MQPIIGTLLGVARPGTPEGKAPVIDWLALYAQDEAGYRQSLRAGLGGASRPAGRGGGACPVRRARRPHRRPDRADRRRGGRARPAARRGAGGRGRRICSSGCRRCSRTGSMSSSAAAAIAVERRAEAALIDLAYARDLPLVATNPACLCRRRISTRAHDAMLCIAQSSQIDRDDRVTLLARGLDEAGRRRCARCSPICPRRSTTRSVDRPALRVRARPSASRSCRSIAGDLEAEAAQLRARRARRAGRRGSPPMPISRRAERAGLFRPARFRARRHHRHGLSRLFPDRRRLHQMGEGAATSRSARAAARAPARWSPGR